MLKKCLVLLSSAALILSACHSPVFNQTEGNVADVKIKMSREKTRQDAQVKTPPALLVKPGMYVDKTPISLSTRPNWLQNHIVIRGDRLPFSYYSRLIAKGAGNQVLTKYQPGLDTSALISMNYSGTVQGALDLLATNTGNVYSIRSHKIFWQSFVTRTFDIAFLPGDSDYLVGKKNEGGGANTSQQSTTAQVSNYTTSDPSQSEYINLSGKISLWKDLKDAITQMLSKDGKVSISQASTSVTVTDKPSNVELVSQYIANLNVHLATQVLVKVQVLEVNLTNAFNYGIDWNIIVNAFHNSPFKINADYGTPISITEAVTSAVVPTFGTDAALGYAATHPGANTIPSYTILLKALNEQGKTSVVTEPRVLCQNNQVCAVSITRNQGYVASIQNTSLPGTSSGGGSSSSASVATTVTSQITPGLLVTGFTLYVIPKIINNKIFMSVNADFSTSAGFRQFGPNGSSATAGNLIELPDVTEKHFNQRSMIKSGETLILAGFKQTRNIAGASQFLTAQSLGGTAAGQVNAETVILITPIILHGNA